MELPIMTGLSGSGKSTIATAVERSLHLQGIRTYLLDGDNIRHGLCSDLGFSAEDRKENIRRIAKVAGLMVDGGSVVIVAAISPNQQDRQLAREVFQDSDFVEIFVDCPVDVCMKRDPKGLYEKAVKGEIPEFTGISSPYDVPLDAGIHLDSGKLSIEDSVEAVLAYIQGRTQKAKISSVV